MLGHGFIDTLLEYQKVTLNVNSRVVKRVKQLHSN